MSSDWLKYFGASMGPGTAILAGNTKEDDAYSWIPDWLGPPKPDGPLNTERIPLLGDASWGPTGIDEPNGNFIGGVFDGIHGLGGSLFDGLMGAADGIADAPEALGNMLPKIQGNMGGLGEKLNNSGMFGNLQKLALANIANKQTSPYDRIAQMMQSQGGSGAYKAAGDKIINQAVLSARQPWDQEIVGTRADYANAIKDTDRYAAGLMAPLEAEKGAAKKREQDQIKAAVKASQAQAASTRENASQAASALGLDGLAGSASVGVANAADIENISTAGDRKVRVGDAQRTADADIDLAGDMQDWARADAMEQKNKLSRQRERRIGDLRGSRASAMSGARASGMQAAQQLAVDAQKAQMEQAQMLLQILGAQTNDAFRSQELGLRAQGMQSDREIAQAKIAADSKPEAPDELEVLKFLLEAQSKTSQVTSRDEKGNIITDKNGRPVNITGAAMTPDQLAAFAQMLGRDPSTIPGYTNPDDEPSLGGMIGDWVKGLFA